jgi:cation:H+ antiporter
MDYLILLLGLVVLVVGAELLVKGAVGCSTAFKISPLVIGMTVVSFGTSAPELIVSVQSALAGNPEIAIGNIVGSNIVNITFILGITVLIYPIIADRQSKRVDYPMMVFASLIFFVFAIDNMIEFYEGVILFLILIAFVTNMVISSRKKTIKANADAGVDAPKDKSLPFWQSSILVIIGLVLLYFGSEWFIHGSVGIAELLLEGNPNKDSIIGVTVVAVGTSTPELVASAVAAYRRQNDIALGNLIGSNILNIFGVIGLTAMLKPTEVSNQSFYFDMPWMIGVAVLLFAILWFGKQIGRFKGVLLILTYGVYIALILMQINGILPSY